MVKKDFRCINSKDLIFNDENAIGQIINRTERKVCSLITMNKINALDKIYIDCDGHKDCRDRCPRWNM